MVKAQQDVKHQPKIRTNSEKLGYQKRGRQLYGPDYKAKIVAPNRGGNDGLMEIVEDRPDDETVWSPFPQPLEITKCGDFAHYHRTTTTTDYDDISALHR